MKKKYLILTIFIILLSLILVGCTKPKKETYNVTFLDYDGTILKQEEVMKNASATPPKDPYREGYEFIGWDKNFSSVYKDLTITAKYNKILINNSKLKIYDYEVPKETIENRLILKRGLESLLDMVDSELLKDVEYSNLDNTRIIYNYLFRSDFSDSSDSKEYMEKRINDYYKSIGLEHENLIKKYEDLILKRYAYSIREYRNIIINNPDYFSKYEYENEYINQNLSELSTKVILVPFINSDQYENYLKKYNVNRTYSSFIDTGIRLTKKEQLLLIINIYNDVYKAKNNVEENILKENIHYYIIKDEYEKETIEFNLEELEKLEEKGYKFTYTYEELEKLGILKIKSVDLYNNTNYPLDDISSINYFSNNTSRYLVVKLEESQINYDKYEIIYSLIENNFTKRDMEAILIKLRSDNNFQINDEVLNRQYKIFVCEKEREYKKLFVETTSILDCDLRKNNICEFNKKTIDRSDLISYIRSYYINVELSDLIEDYLLVLSSSNDIYNPITNEIINKEKYDHFRKDIDEIYENFINERYKSEGYPSTYGWEAFIQDYYGFENENWLLLKYMKDYIVRNINLYNVDIEEVNKEIDMYNKEIIDAVNNKIFFDMGIIHFLISNNDRDIENWTEEQLEYIDEFIQVIINEYNNSKENEGFDRYEAIVEEYNKAFYDDPKWGKYILIGYELILERSFNYTYSDSLIEEFLTEAGIVYDYLKETYPNKDYELPYFNKNFFLIVYGYSNIIITNVNEPIYLSYINENSLEIYKKYIDINELTEEEIQEVLKFEKINLGLDNFSNETFKKLYQDNVQIKNETTKDSFEKFIGIK